MVSPLRNIVFETYRALLQRVLPAGCRFAITDASATVYAKDEHFAGEIIGPARQRLQHDRSKDLSRIVCLRLVDTTVLVAPICVDPSEAVGFLWVQGGEELLSAEAEISIQCVVACLTNDLTLNAELDTMATELTERYEELNLVYHTPDEVNYFAEGQLALSQLVANCCEYLNVDLAALMMRDKGISIDHVSDSELIGDTALILGRLGGLVYNRIAESGEPVVVNNLESPEGTQLWQGLKCRLLATPVMDSKGGASGILAIAKHNSKPRFSNSDKNLLNVMARKAAKIVQVNYDLLTGLVNREGFEFFADKRFQETRDAGATHAILYFNVDNLHVINDTIDHEAGDAVLRAIAALLRGAVRDTDVVARLGGDEFGLLLRQCSVDRAQDIAEKLRDAIVGMLVPWTDRSINATVSIGVAPIDEQTQAYDAALTAANLACTGAKELGKNRVQLYEHGDTALLRRHHEMDAVGTIHMALSEDRFELFGQTIAPLFKPESGIHLEVLLRMRSESGEILTPDKFLPAAERYNMMAEIDRHVFTKTVAYLDANWAWLEPQLSMISINLSGQTFGDPFFAKFLDDLLTASSVPAERICLEITETAAMNNLQQTQEFIGLFRRRGCKFALDDFGSGLSSFGYLRTLAVDILKIDGSLVKEIVDDEVSMSMVAAVQHVAKVMGLDTVAEYVDSEAAKDKLREIGVSYAQGFGISKPMPLASHFSHSAIEIGAAAK